MSIALAIWREPESTGQLSTTTTAFSLLPQREGGKNMMERATGLRLGQGHHSVIIMMDKTDSA